MTKGFTLFEILMYAALLSFLMTGVLMSLAKMTSESSTLQVTLFTEEELAFMFHEIGLLFMGKSYNITTPALYSTSTTLSLVSNGHHIFIFLENGEVKMKEEGFSTTTLTDTSSLLSSIIFTYGTSSSDISHELNVHVTTQNIKKDVTKTYVLP